MCIRDSHAGSVVTAQGIVQALRQTVVVQMGIHVLAPRVQLDQLVLPRSHLEQGDPQTVEDTHHHVLMPTARLHLSLIHILDVYKRQRTYVRT